MSDRKWPDLTPHDEAFQTAKQQLGEEAPVSHLLMRAAQILAEAKRLGVSPAAVSQALINSEMPA